MSRPAEESVGNCLYCMIEHVRLSYKGGGSDGSVLEDKVLARHISAAFLLRNFDGSPIYFREKLCGQGSLEM